MNTRPDKGREYFAKLLNIPEEKIDYGEIPPTTRGDWDDAEVLFPVTPEEFEAIKQFISDRRQRDADATHHPR